jgi:hypothetical protein
VRNDKILEQDDRIAEESGLAEFVKNIVILRNLEMVPNE